ncbi:MAG: GNAT family N-acetyltransferase [Sphingomonas sp.]
MSDVHDNPAHSRYELVEQNHLAFAAYRLADGVIAFTHTYVPPALEGQGIASRLIAFALADARARGLEVRAECAFVRAYLARHPEERDLLG